MKIVIHTYDRLAALSPVTTLHVLLRMLFINRLYLTGFELDQFSFGCDVRLASVHHTLSMQFCTRNLSLLYSQLNVIFRKKTTNILIPNMTCVDNAVHSIYIKT